MAKARRLIVLNRFFYPDHSPTSELLSDVAFALAERGFDVSVVTSRQNYEQPKAHLPAHDSKHGVDIARVWTSPRPQASRWQEHRLCRGRVARLEGGPSG